MTRQRRTRTPLALTVLAAIVVSAVATSIPQTDAQWSDAAVFTTAADTGTWSPASSLGTCAIVDSGGTPVPGETCTVSSINLIENGGLDPGSLLREYELIVTRSTPDPAFDVDFRIDFTSPDVGSIGPAPNPAWSWDNASTTATAGYSPAPGFLCSTLPVLDGTVPGTVTGPVRIDVHDSLVQGRTCA